MQYITLNNGVKMPQMGYGVFQVSPAECERCVSASRAATASTPSSTPRRLASAAASTSWSPSTGRSKTRIYPIRSKEAIRLGSHTSQADGSLCCIISSRLAQYFRGVDVKYGVRKTVYDLQCS